MPIPEPIRPVPWRSQEPSLVARGGAASVNSTPGNAGSDTSSITTQTPDNVIGETLVVQGRVEFQNLLRIDGHFEGEPLRKRVRTVPPLLVSTLDMLGCAWIYCLGRSICLCRAIVAPANCFNSATMYALGSAVLRDVLCGKKYRSILC